MMKKATYGQRAGAMLIDLLIILVVFAVFYLIFQSTVLKPVPETFIKLMDAYSSGSITPTEFMNQVNSLMETAEFSEYLSSYYLFLGLCIATFAVIYILYMIVLPLCWKKGQTVGRFAMKIRVQDEDSNDYSVGTAIIREGVGNLLITILLSCMCCCIPFIINLIILGRGNSIADSLSRSNVFSTIHKEEETSSFDEYFNNGDSYNNDKQNNDFIDNTNTEETDFRINTDEKEDKDK